MIPITITKEEFWRKLSQCEQEFLTTLIVKERLTYQETRLMALAMWDLNTWQANVDYSALESTALIFWKRYDLERAELVPTPRKKNRFASTGPRLETVDLPQQILGRCPVAGEKTRCCGLYTLDIALGCGFNCEYCAIPSFKTENKPVQLPLNLHKRLSELEIPAEVWHVGTGQSSDSLLYAHYNGTAEAIIALARRYPDKIIELKSKSANIKAFLSHENLPRNLIFTWSLNTPPAIAAWESSTAPLEDRLDAARQMRNRGSLVGFHIHPIIPYQGALADYQDLGERVTEIFNPRDVILISFGSLTFSKASYKKIRMAGETDILKAISSDATGKLGIAPERKYELFNAVNKTFKEAGWDKDVFFYLCMEEPALWPSIFGYSYDDNAAFEEAMRVAYFKKVTGN